MPEVDDLSRSLTVFDQARTLLVVVEMSQDQLAGRRNGSRP